MAKINRFNTILPHLGIILLFIVLALAYMFPVLEGKNLEMSDIQHFKGMSKELVDHREETGEEAIWTNNMFSGMPGYLISVVYPGNLTRYVHSIPRSIFEEASFLLLYLLGFYVLFISLKINRWLSLTAAIAVAFSSYFIIIIGAGHTSKANAIAYLAPVIAGVLMAFRGKYLPGALLFAVAFSLELLAGHLQITYYGFLIIAIYGLVELVHAIRNKTLSSFFKAFSFLLAGAIIAIGMNFSRLYTTWQYSKHSIRGPSELTSDSDIKTTGLDKDYVVQWSYGIDETLTLLIPNYKGGGSQINPGLDSESYEALRSNRVQNPQQMVQAVSMYHGDQPGTSGPVYIGAIIIFLFVMGLIIVKGPYKWWLLTATIVSIVLSWGGNIMWLTSFLLDYLPFYNKFRAPSMTLVIAQITMPLLGFIALNDVIAGRVDKKTLLNGLKWSLIVTGGLSLLFALLPGLSGSFTSATDAMRYPEWLIDSMVADRKNMLRSDAFRSLLFIAFAAGALYMWHLKKLKTNTFIIILGLLILVDLWAVDKRYLNNDHFVPARQVENPFAVTPADKAIMSDTDLYFRVLPLPNPFQDARASFFHKNVGGYHAAKLRRYQEMIDNHLQPEIQQMVTNLQGGTPLDSVFTGLPALNMLNTRYVIYDLNQAPIRNPMAHGNAWFVSGYKVAASADEEIAAIKGLDPTETAVVDERFAEHVQGKNFMKDNSGSIRLTEYQPDYLRYDMKASGEQLVVFSDIYYEDGWNAFIDGEPAPHFRVNYVLRAMVIPAGEHTIEFNFHPASYYTGNKVSLASSILLILAIAGYFLNETRKRKSKAGDIKSS